MMAAASGAGAGNSASSTNGDLSSGSAEVDQEIGEMNKAFAVATETNMKITIAKTVDGAEETAAQQRPNIG